MTTPLIEAIARALCAAQGCHASENEMARASDEAQAALTAIAEQGMVIVPREPTLNMLAEGAMQAGYCTDDFTAASSCLPGHVYSSMISAAQGDGA